MKWNFLQFSVLPVILYLIGGWDYAIISLLIVMGLDYLTGVLQAIYNKKLNSKVGLKGIVKKICYLLMIMLSSVVDRIVGDSGTFRTLVIYFLVANDGLSILENLGKMNIPLPKKLLDTLEQLKKKGDE